MRFEVRHHRQTDCDIKTPSTIDGQTEREGRRSEDEGRRRKVTIEEMLMSACNDNELGVFVYPIHSTAMELHKDGERKTIFYVCLI